MPFEKKNVEYQGAEEEQPKEDEAEEEQNNEEENSEGKTVIKSAKNQNYNAPRQDHCFIYRIKKLC